MEKQNCCRFTKLNSAKAFAAGIIATAAMSIVIALMGVNSMKTLGIMLVGAESAPIQYMAGGLLQFCIGIAFAFIYATWFSPMKLPLLIKGLLFGTIVAVVAFYTTPIMVKMFHSLKGNTPPMRCAKSPGAMKHTQYAAIMESPAAEDTAMPPATQASTPMCAQAGIICTNVMCPCNACGPFEGEQSMKAFMMSWVNYLVYAVVLAMAYAGLKKDDGSHEA